jgi:5'-nucleotidase
VILNVNVPGLGPDRVSEAWVTRLGRRVYKDELRLVSEEGGRRRYSIYGPAAGYQEEQGSDFAAIEAGAVSVTPMHFDLTDMDGMGRLEALALADLLAPDAQLYTS